MNERIQELYQKAHKEVVEEDIYTGMPSVELRFDPEKFAELIVRECMLLCQECVDDGCVEAEEPLRKIREHFGVE